ncbi:hypothetical protein RQP46_009817 [Phenoliferia psychrophenolica]
MAGLTLRKLGFTFLALSCCIGASPFLPTPASDAASQLFFSGDVGSPSFSSNEFNLPVLPNNLAIKFDEDGSMLDAHDGKVYWAEDEQLYVLVGAAWVLFWNVHNDHYPERGLEIWTSPSVFGPFAFASRPITLGTPNDFSVGVHGRTGKAYLIYGLNLVGDLTIEELSDDYLEVSGSYIQLPYPAVEGFDLQWHEPTARFYLIFGRLCAYCNGTDTNVISSADALNREAWSPPYQISWDSCGGQSSFLASLPNIYGTETLMFGSDLWDNANPNEAKALMYWEPLILGPHGTIPTLQCRSNHPMDIAPAPGQQPATIGGPLDKDVDQSSGDEGFRWDCNTPNLGETVGKDGTLKEVGWTTGLGTDIHPSLCVCPALSSDGQLNAEVFKFNDYGEVFDSANWIMPPIYDPIRMTLVGRRVLYPENMDWGVKNYKVPLDTPVKKGDRFLLLLGTHELELKFYSIVH